MEKKVYLLVYWDHDGGESSWSEPMCASMDRQKVEDIKKDIEEKSVGIRAKIKQIEKEKYEILTPLTAKLLSLKRDKYKGEAAKQEEERELSTKMGQIHQKYYKKISDLLTSLEMSHCIDDDESQSLSIEEIDLI